MVTIIAVGLAAVHLLAIRQAQINTVHAMAQVHAEVARHESQLEQMRLEIERRCSPALTEHPSLQVEANDVSDAP